MSEQTPQPDLVDRELLTARSRVSISRDIGEAVVTENIFGTAKVRIIRPGDKMRRMLWTATGIAAAVVALVVWQVWLAAQQNETVPETLAVENVAPPDAAVATAPVSPLVETPSAVPHVVATPPHSTVPPTQPAAAVVPPRPVIAPRPPVVQPQSAAAPAGTLATSDVTPRVLPRRLPPRPAASAPVAAAPVAAAPAATESTPAPVAAPQTTQPESEASKP